MAAELLLMAPLRLEALALRGGAPVVRTGMGARRARAAAVRARRVEARAVAIAGFCGALSADLEPGDVVVACELLEAGGRRHRCDASELLARELRQRGLATRSGPLLSLPRLATGRRRASAAETGAIAVDTESAWLAAGAAGRPLAVARVVVDTPSRELHRPLATVAGGLRAYRSLQRLSPALLAWAARVGDNTSLPALDQSGDRCQSP